MERESFYGKEASMFVFEINDICDRKKTNENIYEFKDLLLDFVDGYHSFSIDKIFLSSSKIVKYCGNLTLMVKQLNFYVTE